jgi:2-desacetyl-2-hydroxyethyl bacteriochlorophyllide A dehydrogenase
MIEEARTRAVWFTGPREITLRDGPPVAPEPDEVVIRSSASLISAGTEMLVYRGETAAGDPLPPTSEGTFPFPVKYGYQCVGTVVARGPEAALPVGQRVFARHPHQDLFAIRADPTLVTALPADVDDVTATFTNLARVALTAHLDVPVRLGEIAVVFGQGIVGSLIGRMARRTAGRLVVVDALAARRELALRQGADAAVEPADVAGAVDELSGGQGADVVYEASGAPAALQSAIEVARPYGEIVAVSFYGTRPVPLRLSPEFHFRKLRITSSQAGERRRWDWVRRTDATLRMLGGFGVRDMVSATVPIDDAARAYELVDRHPEETMGVVLDYGRASR